MGKSRERSHVTYKAEFGPRNWHEGLKALALVVLACLLCASPVWLIWALYELGVGQ